MSKSVKITGKVTYKDKTPIRGAKIKIWELDKNNPDDLIVSDTTDRNGNFSGTGVWKDAKGIEIANYRYEITYKGKKKTGKNISDKNFFKTIRTSWLSPKQEKEQQAKASVTISGHLIYKDKTSVVGARVRIWEMDSKSADDLIVDTVTDVNGRFSGTGVWKDGGKIDTPTYRYQVTLGDKEKTGKNITRKKFFETFQTGWLSPHKEEEKSSVTIAGQLVFKDGKSPIMNARVRIWEMDSKSADDLIVDTVTGPEGNFEGTGVWKDGGKGVDTPTYRYEVKWRRKVKSGKNIINKNFFKKLKTGWFSPIQGIVTFHDKAPAEGARVKIWETDNFRPNDADDLIVDQVLDASGRFYGERPNESGLQTFRWEVTVPGTNFKETSTHKEVPKFELNIIRLSNEIPGWKNWIDELKTYIQPHNVFRPTNRTELQEAIEIADRRNLKIKVVGSGHSHSNVAQPENLNAMIELKGLSGKKNLYPWIKDTVQQQVKAQKIEGDFDATIQSYVRVKSGTTLRTLYREVLAKDKLGLINIGPFDGQTIAGLVNTNTHGTGIKLPGFSDMVRSVEMFVIIPVSETENKVELWVIEPSNGISDPDTFDRLADGRKLVQDDDVFHAAVCGYGLFGVAFTYTLAVRNLYWMNERHTPSNWGLVKQKLRDVDASGTPKFLQNNHQVKLYFNTASCVNSGALNDRLSVRIDQWNVLERDDAEFPKSNYRLRPVRYKSIHPIWPPMQKRNLNFVLQSFLEPLTISPDSLRYNPNLGVSVATFDLAFFKSEGLVKYNNKDREDPEEDYKGEFDDSVYYRVLRRGRDNNITVDKKLSEDQADIDNTKPTADPVPQDYGPSIEVCVPVDKTIETIELLMNYIARAKTNGRPKIGIQFLAPMGVRFTAASPHYLAPAHGRASAWIELVGVLPSKDFRNLQIAQGKDAKSNLRHDWPEFMDLYGVAFKQLFAYLKDRVQGITFHKGKYNDYDVDLLRKHYPNSFDKWLYYYQRFSCSGRFDAPNSQKWGLVSTRARLNKLKLAQELEALKKKVGGTRPTEDTKIKGDAHALALISELVYEPKNVVIDLLQGRHYPVGESVISSDPNNVHFIKSPPNFKVDTECYVLKNANGDVIVGFRGSEVPFNDDGGFKDWFLTNFDVAPIKYPLFTGNPGLLGRKQPYVNKGFWEAYNAIRQELFVNVRDTLERHRKIYITGHSLGGALAVHAAHDLSTRLNTTINLYTYGCPRVGNKAFCRELENRVDKIALYANTCDPTPFVPPVGLNITIGNKKYHHPDGIKYFDKNGHLKSKLPIGKIAVNGNHHRIRSYIDKIVQYT